jgi:uncharacterized protein
MINLIGSFCSGLLFAIGLGIAGMTLPQKVLAFLDVTGDWDPSLALVMFSSAGVYFALHRLVLRRGQPLAGARFALPTRRDIDAPLVVGAAMFGAGWGLVGLCPGPAVAALASLHEDALVFFVSMIAGMYAYGTLHVIGSHEPDGGASAIHSDTPKEAT